MAKKPKGDEKSWRQVVLDEWEASGITEAEWSRRAGLSDSTVNRFVTGVRSCPRIDTFAKLADALGLRLCKARGKKAKKRGRGKG